MVSGCDKPPHHGLGELLLLLLLGKESTPFPDHSRVLLEIHYGQRVWIGSVVGDGKGELEYRSGKYIQMKWWGVLCPLGTTEQSRAKKILREDGCVRGKGSGRSVQPTMRKSGDDAHESMAILVGCQSDI
jgi:hypothetical protein